MKRLMVVLGTRPEAIKLCPLILELKKRKGCEVLVCSTRQHREMLDGALRAFGVDPTHTLGEEANGQPLGAMVGRLLTRLEELFAQTSPDAVLVQGDTASAYAGALAAFYASIPVGHVEAGLRTYCIHAPFPEEYHRRAISVVADWHFAPTARARQCLLYEGIAHEKIFVTGNTVVDALRYTLSDDITARQWNLPASQGRIILFTAHRRESLGATLCGMLRALARIAREKPDDLFVFPMHPNPEIRQAASRYLSGLPNVYPIEPPDVIEFHRLLARCDLVMTDSGGIQEECTALGIPTIVMRYSSERTEGMRAGCLRLAGSGEEGIVSLALRLLEKDSSELRSMQKRSAAFGDGYAAVRIADILLKEISPK